MIIDTVSNYSKYPLADVWKKAFAFIEDLRPDMENNKYEIDSDRIFAIISDYETISRENAIVEAHRKYCDIQVLISGFETIECFSTASLEIKEIYNADKDAVFFRDPQRNEVSVNMFPGRFAFFLPEDAHMPQLTSPGKEPGMVKKAVIKIKTDLIIV